MAPKMISLDVSYSSDPKDYFTVIPWKKTLDDADLESNKYWWKEFSFPSLLTFGHPITF